MKIPASHIERIQQLGYTESEARFLYIVAVFSGYFTSPCASSEPLRAAGVESVRLVLLKADCAGPRPCLCAGAECLPLSSLFENALRSDGQGQPSKPEASLV